MHDPSSTLRHRAQHPDLACAELTDTLGAVGTETISLAEASGRVLAEQVFADRDSPPCDVSSMDGYGVRIADANMGPLPVSGEVLMGERPTELPPGHAVKVFTGGPVPTGVECIVRRELTDERAVSRDGVVTIPADADDLYPGAYIRRKGENIKRGAAVIDPGVAISPAHVSALAAFGYDTVRVFKRVRVTLLITGNELRDTGVSSSEFTIRDSNGPALCALFAQRPWIDVIACDRVTDERSVLLNKADGALRTSDAVVFTGGVSMGDHDYVPGVLDELGVRTIFHTLPIRPGKPLLGAVGAEGQAVLGLPGNPASALTTMLRLGMGVLAKRAGLTGNPVQPRSVRIANADEKQLHLWWFRPVRRRDANAVELVSTNGSGDLAALANSDGFVQQAQGKTIEHTSEYWGWTP